MEVIFKLFEVSLCVLEAYLMIDFFMAFFPLRKLLQQEYTKLAAVVMTAVCVRLVNLFESSTINLIAMQIIYLSILFGMFVGKVLKKIFCYLVALAIMMGSEFLWIVIMAAPADFSMNQIQIIQNSRTSGYLALLGIKIIAFLLFVFTKRIASNSNSKMNIKNFSLFSVVPISTLGIMLALAYLNIDFDSKGFIQMMLMICSVLIVIGNILIFSVFDKYIVSMEKLRLQEVVITKMELEEKRYAQIDAVNREHAGFLHDIRRYMHVIGALANERQQGEIIKLLSELQIKVSEAETKIYCPNRLLNTILNEKKKEADEKNLNMQITIEPGFMVDHIENMDLIVIMGNLIDNAIEAAEKCNQGYVNVFLSTQNNNAFSTINIVNNYVGSITTKGDIILSSKQDKAKHGYGIQNVNNVVRKYDGFIQNFYVDNVFSAIVMLPNK